MAPRCSTSPTGATGRTVWSYYFHPASLSSSLLMSVLSFRIGNTLILGVNCEGLMLIKPEDKFVMYEFRYTDVESIFLDPSDCFLTINLMRHQNDNASAHKCFVFETQQKSEIGSLIVSYCPGLAGWIIENEAPVWSEQNIVVTYNRDLRLWI